MCKIDFSTTFLNKSFPHWLYDVLFVYGDIVYAIVSFLAEFNLQMQQNSD